MDSDTHIVVYSTDIQAPVVSIVGDMFHSVRLFCAFRDTDGKNKAFLITRDKKRYPIKASRESELRKALLTTYLMRPKERFLRIADERALLDSLSQADETGQYKGRIGVDFGSIGLCHVAAGFTDAMVEIAKGFALWDLLPGHHILSAAGGVIAGLHGTELSLDLGIYNLADISNAMERRQKFVAAGDSRLLKPFLDTSN